MLAPPLPAPTPPASDLHPLPPDDPCPIREAKYTGPGVQAASGDMVAASSRAWARLAALLGTSARGLRPRRVVEVEQG